MRPEAETVAAEALRSGADDYLQKSEGLKEGRLTHALSAMLARHGLAEALRRGH